MHHLFIIHGMGAHETDAWADKVIDKIKEVSKRYEFFQSNQLEDHINFIPISYDEIIEDIISQWRDNAGSVTGFATEHGIDISFNLSSINDWVEEADNFEENFFWTHIADVLIYRYFLTVQAHIRTHVAEQFVTGINKIKDEFPDNQSSSVLAHSLGTSVVHDSLHMLGTSMFSENQSFRARTHWFFQVMYSLANVSCVLESDFDPYSSVVKPPSGGSNSYFEAFINYRHKLDPFTKVKRFNPGNWGNDYILFELNHYKDWNIHSYEHYLDHPQVHVPMLANMVQNSVTIEEEESAYHDYDSNLFGGNLKCIEEVKLVINSDLKPLYDSIGENLSVRELVPLLIKAYAIYDQIKTIIKECDEE